jgi:hypothetical protein
MIMATPVGKYKSKQLDKFGNPIEKSENPIVKFEQNEKERYLGIKKKADKE